ncbi:MAG: penicillin acylase family protein [Alphaproteobacteria bacterium]|nr:penicillin acylase family protein [Alphaproteobacteria bacterium]
MIRSLLAGTLLLLVLVCGGAYFYLRTSLPQVDGRMSVPGLHGPITIARDADGVPLISGASDEDVSFGLGFAHAQDRLFQMEMMRRYGAGRLSEVLGQATVGIDRQMRVLALYRFAEQAVARLSPAVRQGLDAYAAGVNAYIATRGGPLAAWPPEFLLLGFAPQPWRPADSLVWGKLMALDLAGNYRGELLRAKLLREIPADALNFIYPQYPKGAVTTLAELRVLYRQLPLDALNSAVPDRVGPIYASNNWVVDGAHSESGKPLLANDPHLGFTTPLIWYLARLKTPDHEIDGATSPGVPLVVIGHNERIAWGFTNTASDLEDLFIEKLDPADQHRYLAPGGNLAFETHDEQIAVKDAPSVSLTVRSTRHGPVLSDALPPGTAESGYVIALQASYLTPDDRTPQALWEVSRAADWAGFRDALHDFIGPQQNIVFAGQDGTIGFIAPGHVPIRKSGDGWMPMPGWTGEYDWSGFIPFEELPQGTAPPAGHFVSANNKIVPDSYPYFLSRDWDLPNRAERITALLQATPKQSQAASAAIQADTLSLAAQRLVPLMTRISASAGPSGDMGRAAIERLQHWDYRMDADKVEPLLFIAWLKGFAHDVFAQHLGAAAGAEAWDLKPLMMQAVLTDHPEWCGRPEVHATSCDALLVATLDHALSELSRTYGSDMNQWQWSRAHIAQFPNRLFDRVPILADMLHLSAATQGGFDTINRGSPDVRDAAHPFEQRFGAGLRIITDMAAPGGSRMMIAPGQSGNPLSSHYADLLQRWRAFDWLVPGQAPAVATLTLEPAP